MSFDTSVLENNLNGLDTIRFENIDIEELISMFNNKVDELIQVIDQFPIELVYTPIVGNWSLKQLLDHFTEWNYLTVSNIFKMSQGEDSRWIEEDQIDEFNQDSVDLYAIYDWEVSYAEFISSTELLQSVYIDASTEDWQKSMRLSAYFPLFWSLIADIWHFGYAHTPEVRTKLNQLLSNES